MEVSPKWHRQTYNTHIVMSINLKIFRHLQRFTTGLWNAPAPHSESTKGWDPSWKCIIFRCKVNLFGGHEPVEDTVSRFEHAWPIWYICTTLRFLGMSTFHRGAISAEPLLALSERREKTVIKLLHNKKLTGMSYMCISTVNERKYLTTDWWSCYSMIRTW
jgi:hypothetical protein